MNNNIPVSQTNIGGNKVSDLVEALLKLDQDTRLNGLDFVKSSGDVLELGVTFDTWLEQLSDETGLYFPNRQALTTYLYEAEENEETIKNIRKLV